MRERRPWMKRHVARLAVAVGWLVAVAIAISAGWKAY
jgi:hypothetical protein